MIAVLQRVTSASVQVDEQTVGAIGHGLMVLVAVQPEDDAGSAERMLDRLLRYRVFSDENGKMNLSLTQVQGGLLLVPQFTLAADTSSGNRPGFSTAASPDKGQTLFAHMVQYAQQHYANVETGIFGADMQVALVNDGPVTFTLTVS